MITVHHLLVSQSERVIWLLEELGVPYQLKSYSRDPETRLAHPAFLELHPLGQAPVIEDGDVTLAESLAIFTYILDLYDGDRLRIRPGERDYAEFVYWYHYAGGGLATIIMQHLMTSRMGEAAGPLAAWIAERLTRNLGMIDARLAEASWLGGDTFTAADIACHFPFGTFKAFAEIDISKYPNIRSWLARISDRPAYQRAMKLAGHETDPAMA